MLNRPLLRAFVLLACAACPAFAGDPPTSAPLEVVGPGASLPGYGGATVSEWAFSALSDSGTDWVTGLIMSDFVNVMASSSGTVIFNGQVLQGGEVINSISSGTLDGAGHVVALVGLVPSPFPLALAIVIDDKAVLQHNDPLVAPGVPAGSTWNLGLVTKVELRDAGFLDVAASLFVPPNQDSLQAIVRFTVAGSGDLVNPQVLRMAGDVVDGRQVLGIGDWDADTAGQLAAVLTLQDAGGSGTSTVLAAGDTVLFEAGTASLIAGRDWLSFHQVHVDDLGDLAFQAKATNPPAPAFLDSMIVMNGQLVTTVGDQVAHFPGTSLGVIRKVSLADDGTLAWYGEWGDYNPVFNLFTNRGLFADGDLVVRASPSTPELSTSVQGSDLGFIRDWALADDGSRLVFTNTSTFPGNPWGLFAVGLRPWADLRGTLPGLLGLAGVGPLLVGDGTLQAGSPTTLTLSDAFSGSTTNLIIGFSQLGLPFKGGVLCPSFDVAALGLPVDAQGQTTVTAVWPAGVPTGTEFWSQFWTADGFAPQGFSASNCIRGTAP